MSGSHKPRVLLDAAIQELINSSGERLMDKALLQDLQNTYMDVQQQMTEILANSMEKNIPPETLRDVHGGYIWAPLLVAKAQLLHAITLLTKENEGKNV